MSYRTQDLDITEVYVLRSGDEPSLCVVLSDGTTWELFAALQPNGDMTAEVAQLTIHRSLKDLRWNTTSDIGDFSRRPAKINDLKTMGYVGERFDAFSSPREVINK